MANDYDSGAEPYPRSPTRQPYRGPRRRHRETGRVEVWVEGQGYVPQGSLYTVPQQDRESVQAGRSVLTTARRNAQLADQFAAANATPRRSLLDAGGETGGTAALPVPAWTGMQNPTRQRMEGISNQMVRANIQPGQAGTMNSVFEQILAKQQYPTTDTDGRVNTDRVIQMHVDADEIAAALEEMERRVRNNQSLDGFDVYWFREGSPRVRAESERRHRARFSIPDAEGGPLGAVLQAPQRPPGVPASAQWNAQARRWEE